jgi:hypothetical protein
MYAVLYSIDTYKSREHIALGDEGTSLHPSLTASAYGYQHPTQQTRLLAACGKGLLETNDCDILCHNSPID